MESEFTRTSQLPLSTEDVFTVVDTIYSGSSTCITRARRGNDFYIVKSNFKLLHNKKKLYKYFKEYSIGLSIHSDYVIRYIDFKRLGYGFAIIMDDIGGKRLSSVIPREGFPIDTFLEIACRIVQGLTAVHSAGVMHKDINPMNIVVNMETKALNIIDFGMASQMHVNEVPPKPSPTNMQGTLLYMSPEQTGRMNRVVDFRTDFYSLGVTFYEMLTGEPPFSSSTDPLDLIYKHMAVDPKRLIEVRPEVGKPISDIVGKLLSKNAEDRYQDCKGLMVDLKAVQRAGGQEAPMVDFVAGKHDQLCKLHVSQKLYGREEEVRRLTNNFELVCDASPMASTLVLVHGYSGVGKTALVHEVHKPLARRYGYYVSGKFDQFNAASPFSALIQAIQLLLQQILTESEEQVLSWKQRILKGVGSNGQIVIDIIPELELIIGSQPTVPNVGAVEALHRAKQVMSYFVFSLTCKEHPLVIFLDDLQWADSNTLALLVRLLDPQLTNTSHYLLIVGAYRDNEVDATHPLSMALGEVNRKGGKVDDIPLLPLDELHVTQLLEDTFNTSMKSSRKINTVILGKLVYKKTQGNPFFVNQLLVKLHKDGHIYSVEGKGGESMSPNNLEEGGWECNMEAIHEANYSSNAVDLMVAALQMLDVEVQQMLGMAATIGNRFQLVLLARLCDKPEIDVAVALHTAVRGGFLISNAEVGATNHERNSGKMVLVNAPSTSTDNPIPPAHRSSSVDVYRFVHDRVQQAAALLFNCEDTRKTHVKLAEQLLELCALNNDIDFHQSLLSIVNHINKGYACKSPPTREITPRNDHTVPAPSTSYLPFSVYTVASLNILAAIKAKASNAYHEAREYTDVGIALLEKDVEASWRDQYSLCMGLYCIRATLQNLLGDFTVPPCEELLARARTTLEKSDIFVLLHDRHEAESNMATALKMGFEGLKLLGIDLPEDPNEQKRRFLDNIQTLTDRVSNLSHMSHLTNLPDCQDPLQLKIFKLLSITWSSAFFLGLQSLAGIVCSQIVMNSMDYGLCPESGTAMVFYVLHGMVVYSDYTFLNQLALTGLRILDSRYPHHKSLRGEAYLMYGLGIASRVYPLSECVQFVEASFQFNVQSGNILWATYGAPYFFEYPFMFGMNLKKVVIEYEKYLISFWKAEAEKFGMYSFMEAAAQPIWEFLGIERDMLRGERYEDSIFAKIPLYQGQYNFSRMHTGFFMGNRKNLLQYSDRATELMPVCFVGLYRVPESETVTTLAYLDWVSRLPLAYEMFGNRRQKLKPRHVLQGDDADIDSEPADSETQLANLNRRLSHIENNIKHLTQATVYCQANFFHKALIMRAELARVAIMFQSNAIYSAVKVAVDDPLFKNVGGRLSDLDDGNEKGLKHRDFEEAMVLYETAIESAQQHGFQQYEALCLELYGQFWLTAPTKPKEQFAYIYFSEAIVVYERWGATEKAALLRKKCAMLAPYDSFRADNKPRRKKNNAVSSIDLDVIVQASQTISTEIDFDTLVIKMINAIVENASAQKGTFFLAEEESESPKAKLWVCAEYAYESRSSPTQSSNELLDCTTILRPRLPLAEWKNGPLTVVNYVRRTLQPVVLQCASEDAQFGKDDYIVARKAKSIVCMPILLKNVLKGVMYLENNLCDELYDNNHVNLLRVLTSQMVISLENIRFLHDQMEKQSEQLRFEQLQKEEKLQRDRADAAEKYKIQLENFVDMICHEIRNPLNGIFGNTDLMFYYLDAVDEILQSHKLVKNLSCSTSSLSSSTSSTPITSPMVSAIRDTIPKTPPTKNRRGLTVDAKLSLSRELGTKSGEEAVAYLLEQVAESARTIQKCADHQKCMTDDVLQLSRLRSNKLTITSTFYRPFDTVNTAVTIFKPQADAKHLYLNLQAEYRPKDVEVLGDPVRIYQILSNFLSNALKFTHKGGVTISLSIVDAPPQAKDSCPEHHTNLSLSASTSLGASTLSPPASPAYPVPTTNAPIVPRINLPARPASPSSELLNRESIDCMLTFGVKDTGIGMSDEEQARIFKRFSQANNRTAQEYGGTGLGLAICRKLAKLMHGTVSMQSDKGKGSSFTLSIPCKRALYPAPPLPSAILLSPTFNASPTSVPVPDAVVPADTSHSLEISASPVPLVPPSTPPPPIVPAPPKKILIVEDNVVNQTVLSRVLKIKGHLIEIANNGAEGIDQYRIKGIAGDWFDVVFMDLQMPVMDGLTCTELIRKFEIEMGRPPTLIVGLSGNARDEYRQTAIAAGMNEYITKPYHKEVLYGLLEQK